MFFNIFFGLILLFFIVAFVEEMFSDKESNYCSIAKLFIIITYTFCFIKYTGMFQ